MSLDDDLDLASAQPSCLPDLSTQRSTSTLRWVTPSHILGAGWISYCLGARLPEAIVDLQITQVNLLALGSLLMCLGLAWQVHLKRTLALWSTPALCITLCLNASIITQSRDRSLMNQKNSESFALFKRDTLTRGLVLERRERGEGVTIIVEISEEVQSTPQLNLQRLRYPLTVAWRIRGDLYSGRQGDVVWLSGRLARLRGRPSPELFDPAEWWERRGVTARGAGRVWLSSPERGWRAAPQRWISAARARLAGRLSRRESAGAALVRGVTLGDSSLIDREDLRVIRALGLGHLLAVSGLHIGICAGLFGGVAYYLSILFGSVIPRRWALIGGALSAWIYVAITGYPLSAQRAAWMLTVWASLTLYWDLIKASTAVWLAGWLIILDQPSIGGEMSLQLSLSATLSLCSWATPTPHLTLYHRARDISRASSWWSRGLINLKYLSELSVKIAWTSWLITSPIVAWHLGEVSLISPISNAIITPILSALYLPLVLVSALLSELTSQPLSWIISAGDELMSLLKYAPHKSTFTLSASRWVSVALGCVAIAWALRAVEARHQPQNVSARLLLDPYMMIERRCAHLSDADPMRRRLKLSTLTCLLIAWLLMWIGLKDPSPASVRFLSVGQGDATLLINGAQEYALFDVGPPSAGESVARRLRLMGVQRVSWVAISHLHPDHYGGLSALMRELPIDQVITHGRSLAPPSRALLDSAQSRETINWESLRTELKALKIPITTAPREVRHSWGHLQLHWLLSSPPNKLSENDASLALLISGSSAHILLSGDLEARGERRLMSAWSSAGLDQLPLYAWQADHHGSATSSLPETLALLKPSRVVLSLDGLHRFGFPHPQTIRRLAERRIKRIRLDLHGDLTVPLEW